VGFCQGGIGVAGEVHTGVSLKLRRIIHDVISAPKPGSTSRLFEYPVGTVHLPLGNLGYFATRGANPNALVPLREPG